MTTTIEETLEGRGGSFANNFPSVGILIAKGLAFLAGLLITIQGIFSTRTYTNRKDKDKVASVSVIRSYDAACFFVGIGIGLMFHVAFSVFEKIKIIDIIFIYVLIAIICVYSGYVVNRMDAIAKNEKTSKSIAATSQAISLGVIGAGVGIFISVIFATIGKFVEGPAEMYLAQAEVITTGIILAASCANAFYLYDKTGKNDKKALGISITFFILTVLIIAGAIALFFVGG
jgi:hypothetical protein